MNPDTPVDAAVTFVVLAPTGWWFFTLFQAGRRSPFAFTIIDAQLPGRPPDGWHSLASG
jgi:hypothetical protein